MVETRYRGRVPKRRGYERRKVTLSLTPAEAAQFDAGAAGTDLSNSGYASALVKAQLFGNTMRQAATAASEQVKATLAAQGEALGL